MRHQYNQYNQYTKLPCFGFCGIRCSEMWSDLFLDYQNVIFTQDIGDVILKGSKAHLIQFTFENRRHFMDIQLRKTDDFCVRVNIETTVGNFKDLFTRVDFHISDDTIYLDETAYRHKPSKKLDGICESTGYVPTRLMLYDSNSQITDILYLCLGNNIRILRND